jgi:hypothetical protein
MVSHQEPAGRTDGEAAHLTREMERTLKRYVLGELEPEPRLELEKLLITDPDAFEALGVIEDELIEEYLDRTGSQTETRSFERSFLSSPQGMRRLAFARSLRARASPTRAAVRSERWRPAWLGLAAALLMSLTANVWQALRLRASARPSSPLSAEHMTAPPNYTFALTTGLLRAGGSLPRLTWPADTRLVRLRLELPANDYPAYRAVLLDSDGDEIWAASKLRADDTGQVAVVLVLPSVLLPSGDYQAKLSGIAVDSKLERLASYPFRVRTQ